MQYIIHNISKLVLPSDRPRHCERADTQEVAALEEPNFSTISTNSTPKDLAAPPTTNMLTRNPPASQQCKWLVQSKTL